MKIVSLAENTAASSAFEAEHGLSLYIEVNGKKILFDMGQTGLFARNAERLGIDLGAVDFAVLSHGHYDHGGGLAEFLRLNAQAPVYLSRFAFEPHFNGEDKYIGLDTSLCENERLIFTAEEHEIAEGFTLYSCNNAVKNFNLGSFGLNMLEGDSIAPDDFRHEQYLLIEERGKRVLISGCSHKGIPDIAAWFEPDVLVGGFHFSKLSPGDELRGYAEYLGKFKTHFYTCHCTGLEQYEFMKGFIPRLDYLASGGKFII